MRAVAVVIHRIAIVIDDIESVHVVDWAGGRQIVVLIGLNDLRARPDVIRQIRM